MQLRHPSSVPGPRRGFVLLAVLVFILLLSMVAVSLLFRSRAEETGASASAGSEQAWATALSGLEEALRVAGTASPGVTDWADSPALFRERLVVDDGADRWYFTVFSPGDSDSLAEVRYGLTDEAGRLNLNEASAAALTKIPRVTPALAQAVRRHVGDVQKKPTPDADPAQESPSEVAPSSGLDPALDSKAASTGFWVETGVATGPLSTVDELLLVPGFTSSLLRGEDANLNGRLDANENDGDEQFPPDNKDGRLDHGMAQYFTVVSYEPNRTRAGLPRTDLNNPRAPLPATELPAGFTNYLAALRTAKVTLRHPADALEASVTAKNEKGDEVTVASGITKEELPRLLDLFSADGQERHSGLINLNTASATVLATVPGIDLPLAETIVSTRASLGPDRRTTSAWLYQEGVVDAVRFKTLAPYLTTGSFQFSFHVIGYGVPSGRYRVLDATIDVAGGESRILRLRDITRLGLPFSLLGEESENSAFETTLTKP